MVNKYKKKSSKSLAIREKKDFIKIPSALSEWFVQENKKRRPGVGKVSQNPCTLLMRMEISMGAAQTTGSRTMVDSAVPFHSWAHTKGSKSAYPC